jgi:AbrB family looped-hinge helix DNA binding protein
MTQTEKADITVVSEKGQVVIPQTIRKKLGIGPKTKLLIYGYQDAVIMKKLEVPNVTKELQALYKRIDNKKRRADE